jgi:serine/threonine protein kinase
LKEFLVLSDLNHPHIVPFFGVCTGLEGLPDTPCMVFEWMENGTLEGYLGKKVLNEAVFLKLVYEFSMGLEFLHTRIIPVVHGDLRAVSGIFSFSCTRTRF